jgi:hypothetical protein
MDSEIKKQWVRALRSEDYAQGTDWLNADGRYCCLGVLCELAVEAGVVEKEVYDEEDSTFMYGRGGDSMVLPKEVQHWSGLIDPYGKYPGFSFRDREILSLARDNDEGKSFAEIADIIEERF